MPDSNQPFFAAVDVGGTAIKLGLVDAEANSHAYDSIPTDQDDGAENAAKRSAEAIHKMVAEAGLDLANLKGVGLATPGPMDIPGGMLHCPGNLPAWHNEPIRKHYEDAFKLPVAFDNDANAAAYGEYWAGAGKELNSMVLFTLGTGVGAGIILRDKDGNPQIIHGEHSCGGELGHIIIDASDDAPLNSLGVRGTLEGFCGSYGVVARANAKLADEFVETSLRDSVEGGEKLTPLLVANAAEAGDEVAMQIVLETAKYLSLGVVSAIHSIDPEGIVIAGNMTFGGAGHPLGEKFLAELQEQTNARLFPNLRGKISINFAKLGGKAGYMGAAGIACRDFA